jgi:tripartite-type tricarboxylate transporter receptor subunit TctC
MRYAAVLIKRQVALLALSIAVSWCGNLSAAQETTRIVVPFAPGGGGDLLARMLAPRLSGALGRPVIVENRTGAGGQLAMQHVRSAPADGTVVVLASDHASIAVPLMASRAGYDTLRDFASLGHVARVPYALVASERTAANTLPELLQYLRKHPESANVGVPSAVGVPAMIASAVSEMAGVQLTVVPFNGAGPIATSLIGGQIATAAVGLNVALTLRLQGHARILAITGDRHAERLPDVPTFDELGVEGLGLVSSWVFLAPRGVPTGFVAAFNDALKSVLLDREIREALTSMSMQPVAMTAEETARDIQERVEVWARLVRHSSLVQLR